jgi:site-specific DNA-methyltransferase (adenine-specific)
MKCSCPLAHDQFDAKCSCPRPAGLVAKPLPIYDLNGITIYNANCSKVDVPIECVDLVLTDPPYGINLDTKYARRGGRDWPPIEGDAEPFDPSWLLKYERLILWGGNHFAASLPSSPAWIVWDKRDGGPSNDQSDCEMAWSNISGRSHLFSHYWAGAAMASEHGYPRVHPTQKPVSLMVWLLERFSKPGDLIYDPYMGSGPVAMACHLLERRYIGVEIVPEYAKAAVARLQQGVFVLS